MLIEDLKDHRLFVKLNLCQGSRITNVRTFRQNRGLSHWRPTKWESPGHQKTRKPKEQKWIPRNHANRRNDQKKSGNIEHHSESMKPWNPPRKPEHPSLKPRKSSPGKLQEKPWNPGWKPLNPSGKHGNLPGKDRNQSGKPTQ